LVLSMNPQGACHPVRLPLPARRNALQGGRRGGRSPPL
jgi:hypothetical protein